MRQFDPEIENALATKISEYSTSNEFGVPDPEVLKLVGYEKVYEIISRCINNFFNYLCLKHQF